MKKRQITYGVSGMMEYQTIVKVGKKNVSINFTDGSMSAMGTNPATYSTDNIIMQNAVEASSDFKRGLIRVVQTIELEEELPIVRNKPNNIDETDIKKEGEKEDSCSLQKTENSEQGLFASVENEIKKSAVEKDEDAAKLIEIEFENNDDAKDYLEEKFGYLRSKMRTRADIIALGKASGLEIKFI